MRLIAEELGRDGVALGFCWDLEDREVYVLLLRWVVGFGY